MCSSSHPFYHLACPVVNKVPIERERNEQRLVLVLVRLDQAVMQIEDGWPASIRNTRNIGDFTRWKDHDVYQQAFTRLLRDLKAEAS